MSRANPATLKVYAFLVNPLVCAAVAPSKENAAAIIKHKIIQDMISDVVQIQCDSIDGLMQRCSEANFNEAIKKQIEEMKEDFSDAVARMTEPVISIDLAQRMNNL